jgi:hypothetical protein
MKPSGVSSAHFPAQFSNTVSDGGCPDGCYVGLRLSRDGRKLAVERVDDPTSDTSRLSVVDLQGGPMTPLTDCGGRSRDRRSLPARRGP